MFPAWDSYEFGPHLPSPVRMCQWTPGEGCIYLQFYTKEIQSIVRFVSYKVHWITPFLTCLYFPIFLGCKQVCTPIFLPVSLIWAPNPPILQQVLERISRIYIIFPRQYLQVHTYLLFPTQWTNVRVLCNYMQISKLKEDQSSLEWILCSPVHRY